MTRRRRADPLDALPDVRDGLTRVERVVLTALAALQQERPGRTVPVAQLYGRVAEHLDLTEAQLQRILQRLGARPGPSLPRPATESVEEVALDSARAERFRSLPFALSEVEAPSSTASNDGSG